MFFHSVDGVFSILGFPPINSAYSVSTYLHLIICDCVPQPLAHQGEVNNHWSRPGNISNHHFSGSTPDQLKQILGLGPGHLQSLKSSPGDSNIQPGLRPRDQQQSCVTESRSKSKCILGVSVGNLGNRQLA